MARRAYYVSGVVQIVVYADNATQAVERAADRAANMETGRVTVSLDNISTAEQPSVSLEDAHLLDD